MRADRFWGAVDKARAAARRDADGPLSRGALLVATAPLVLAESSPTVEFQAWLRFFVDEFGFNGPSGSAS